MGLTKKEYVEYTIFPNIITTVAFILYSQFLITSGDSIIRTNIGFWIAYFPALIGFCISNIILAPIMFIVSQNEYNENDNEQTSIDTSILYVHLTECHRNQQILLNGNIISTKHFKEKLKAKIADIKIIEDPSQKVFVRLADLHSLGYQTPNIENKYLYKLNSENKFIKI